MQPQRDLIIVGAGAAGLSAALYALEAGLNTLVIEEMAAGGQALAVNELLNFPGFPNSLSGVDFSMRLEMQARNLGAEILNTSVVSLVRKSSVFILETGKGQLQSAAVILATGSKPKQLGISEEKDYIGKGVSYCAACDGPFFKHKRILVVGGGDSACDEAMYLSELSEKISLVHQGEHLKARSVLAEKVRRNPRIKLYPDTEIAGIQGQQKVQSAILKNNRTGETAEHHTDAVFVFIGSIPRSELAAGVRKDKQNRLLTNDRMETSVPGLFAAGEVRNTPFRQLVVAAGEGAVAAKSAAEYIKAKS
ncbi:FAD-dependent oxidoreductase [Marispirochaeta sp.]|jgi:thioredoxin reductase (NADPH)|uniref:NAD(P)/FAD-dependent oxidoreductase n=1 Tax=Marispirochaeta sp. TaxID=2038653 RepID=UPI0029C920FE|nr:FAD-dependent oxidoreductase [Marispirochaeta sp.]